MPDDQVHPKKAAQGLLLSKAFDTAVVVEFSDELHPNESLEDLCKTASCMPALALRRLTVTRGRENPEEVPRL